MNDVRANIFYERENTAYYFGSSQGDARFRNTRVNNLQVESGATITSINGSGRIYMGGNFHIDAYNGNDIFINYYSNRIFRVYNSSSAERFRVDTNGITYAFSQVRSPIYYDYNSTSYYFDGASTTRMNVARANDYYADNWYRNYNSGEGMYNQATGLHWFSDASNRWRAYSNTSSLRIMLATSGNNNRGYVYADTTNAVGFLDVGGNWAIKHTNDNGTRFYTDNGLL